MVDAYKEHPDVLSRVLVDFLEHQRLLVQQKFGEIGQPTGKEYDKYSRIINDAIDLQKKIADGNGKTYKYARELEKKIEHFNNNYAHSFVLLDLDTAVRMVKRTVMGEPSVPVTDDSSDDESALGDEKKEQVFALSPNVRDLTSMSDVPLAKDAGWVTYPLNEDVEYATNFTINGKHIMRLTGKNVYVVLCPPASMGGEGDVPDLDVIERTILSKMKLRDMSDSERQKLYQEEPESEEDVVEVVGPTDKSGSIRMSEVKWKRFDRKLEYSKNLFVNGKHILKKRKEDVVVGL
ncbi:hypothetical protein EDD11_000680, partial [Mortierella claussenii]